MLFNPKSLVVSRHARSTAAPRPFASPPPLTATHGNSEVVDVDSSNAHAGASQRMPPVFEYRMYTLRFPSAS